MVMIFNEESAPSATSGQGKLYTKTDGGLYYLDQNGEEKQINKAGISVYSNFNEDTFENRTPKTGTYWDWNTVDDQYSTIIQKEKFLIGIRADGSDVNNSKTTATLTTTKSLKGLNFHTSGYWEIDCPSGSYYPRSSVYVRFVGDNDLNIVHEFFADAEDNLRGAWSLKVYWDSDIMHYEYFTPKYGSTTGTLDYTDLTDCRLQMRVDGEENGEAWATMYPIFITEDIDNLPNFDS